jgi:hypothetical protein
MSRAAALTALLIALAGCRVTLNFDGRDAAQGCVTDQDCPLPMLHCNPASGECYACVTDQNCTTAGLGHCETDLYVCVQCGGGPTDCDAGSQCNATTHTCVRSCSTNADCASLPGTHCNDGVCAQCDDDWHCAAGTSCDLASYQCAACSSDQQCSAGSRCVRALGRCVQCLTSDECGPGAACDPADWTCKTPS